MYRKKHASINDDLDMIYNAMLANKNLKEALRVAETANRRLPGDPLWMQRVATVNEWSGRAPQALQAWLAMARATNNPEAWQAVLRLAPGLNDEMGYLEALLHQVGKTATELLLVDQIDAAYERLGQAGNALAFLSSQMARSTHPRELLERYAALADRAGKEQIAMQAYQRLNREFGPQTAYALKLASIYNARGDFDAACEALMSARAKVAPQDAQYWRILGRAAGRAGRDDVAKDAARHLIASNTASAVDMESAVTLWRDSPIDAARLAEAAFRQSGSTVSLQEAVYFYSRAKAWPRIESLLASLTPEQAERADKAPEFLMAKAEFLRETGRNDAALKVLRVAIAQDDSASEVRAAFLWMLVDRGSYNELSEALTRWRHDAENDSLLWAPYAAGYVKLSNQASALHFFHKQGSEKLKDPLWALGYADALENFGQADRAWSIRHQTWVKIAQHRSAILAPLSPVGAVDSGDEQDAQAHAELRARSVALSQEFTGADVSRNLLLQVLRRRSADRQSAAPETSAANPAIAHVSAATEAIGEDVALAWAMSNESNDQASIWLAQRYARQLERPAYAEVAIALANDDLAALDKLLADNPDRIPLLSRIEANARLERNSEARRLEFAGIDGNPDNDELQARLRATALQIASYVEPRASEFRQSPLRYTETGITMKQQLDDRLSLMVQALQRNQHSDNATQLINIPRHDQLLTLGLDWKSGDTDVLAEAGSRNAVKSLLTARIKAAWDQRTSVSWNAALGYNQEATESAILRVGGAKDNAVLGANWRISSHDFLQAQGEAARYYAQDRTYVGSGTVFQVDVGHHFRLEYPDFTLRAVFTRADYHGNGDGGSLLGRLSPGGMGPFAGILPSNFTQSGLVFGFGGNLQDSYSRAWRPFLEAGMLHDTIAGWALSGRVGMAGSVLGNDQGILYYAHERSAGSGDAGASEIGMRYRWYY
ncbi:MAG: hypothetical protein NVSMB28_18220 [Collimonas sp.]